MAWVAVDKDGGEVIYSIMPYRWEKEWIARMIPSIKPDAMTTSSWMRLPKGSIEKLIGRPSRGRMNQWNSNKQKHGNKRN